MSPDAAISYFRAKGLKPTFAWQDMLGEEHIRAFTVAKMMDADLLDTVRQHGLMVIGEEGEVFDPEWHEAMGHEVCPDMDPGCIASVFQKGYKLKERLLRPARVIISKKE